MLEERKDLNFMIGKTVEKVFSRKNYEFMTIQFTDGTFVNIYNVADKEREPECISAKVDYVLTESRKSNG
ncbi:hypothetical protein BEH_07755 [Priestia filamentosa]|uniref:Uncharacterized protein n=1 Tax=Priestia filamentosa TaxID=1402861 RepID=A0A0H4KI83_9BACI|nr:hypothetical protein [Priestia filamentosa]AKO92004.1 hypothetical protein BEH_07755 [Priestia filamentosa]